jgi:hypothetical protein
MTLFSIRPDDRPLGRRPAAGYLGPEPISRIRTSRRGEDHGPLGRAESLTELETPGARQRSTIPVLLDVVTGISARQQ